MISTCRTRAAFCFRASIWSKESPLSRSNYQPSTSLARPCLSCHVFWSSSECCLSCMRMLHPKSQTHLFRTNPNHRAYSAHEFSSLSNKLHKNAQLPLDIKLETLISVLAASVGLVLGSEPLKPISWNAWAGKIEREGRPNPFRSLEDRVGFVDIRAQRKEFADWARQQSGAPKS